MVFAYVLGLATGQDDDERRAYLKAFGMNLKLKRAARGLTQGEFGNHSSGWSAPSSGSWSVASGAST